jgi:hypothetical protein
VAKDQIQTTMNDGFHKGPIDMKPAKADVFDQNPSPHFDKKHDRGPDTIPVVFKEGMDGLAGSAVPLGGKAAISTTMGGVSKKS